MKQSILDAEGDVQLLFVEEVEEDKNNDYDLPSRIAPSWRLGLDL